jgi:hypothetical protein
MKIVSRYDDLRCRVLFANNTRALELISRLQDLRALPYDKLPFGERFPSTIEEFRLLSVRPKIQRHVARYLLSDDEDARKRLFTQGGLYWRIEDTSTLRKAIADNVSRIILVTQLQVPTRFSQPLEKRSL